MMLELLNVSDDKTLKLFATCGRFIQLLLFYPFIILLLLLHILFDVFILIVFFVHTYENNKLISIQKVELLQVIN